MATKRSKFSRLSSCQRTGALSKATKQEFRGARAIRRTIPPSHTPNHTCDSYPLYQPPGTATSKKHTPMCVCLLCFAFLRFPGLLSFLLDADSATWSQTPKTVLRGWEGLWFSPYNQFTTVTGILKMDRPPWVLNTWNKANLMASSPRPRNAPSRGTITWTATRPRSLGLAQPVTLFCVSAICTKGSLFAWLGKGHNTGYVRITDTYVCMHVYTYVLSCIRTYVATCAQTYIQVCQCIER